MRFPALLVATLTCAASVTATAQAPAVPSADVQIARAVSPLPEELQAGATVLGYKTPGKLETIRAGKNDMICLEPDPAAKNFHTACYHQGMEAFMARGRALRAEGVKGPMVDSARFSEVKKGKLKVPAKPSMMYQIFGGTFDATTGKVTGGERLFVTYIPFATAATTGLSPKPSEKLPWIMFPGTPKAHIMFSSSM